MFGLPPRRDRTAERSRGPLWAWPLGAGTVAFAAAVGTGLVRPTSGPLAWPWFADTAAVASAMQAVATSVMAALTLTFSLTVVALQLASQQFSPRLLREFTRDPVTKWVLAVLTAGFVFPVTLLQLLRQDEPAPTVAALLGYLLGVLALVAVLAFITHMVRMLRVDTMMVMVHDETARAIDAFYPPYDDEPDPDPEALVAEVVQRPGSLVAAARSGFVQAVDVDRLVACASAHGAVVVVTVRPGDHVVTGTPVASVHPDGAGGGVVPDIDDEVRATLRFGYERTLDQDAGFGFRQLEDIAVKAVSPSVNDPVTAAHAAGHLGDLLVRVTGCRLGPTAHLDDEGAPRAVVPDRDLRYYLDLATGQLRRFGAGEPSVLVALLRMLRDVAVSCRDDAQRAEVRRASALVIAVAEASVVDDDGTAVDDLCRRVELALVGRVEEAYADRAGETRSL